MEPEFWHQRWQLNDIGFHEPTGNALLVKWFRQLGLVQGQRVFVPLCGKTHDINWLLSQGFRVAGVELSEVAVCQLFDDLQVKAEVSEQGAFSVYAGPGLEVFVGNFFQLSATMLGPVNAIYDRAALVAMPPQLRGKYCDKLMAITHRVPQLLIAFEYDQSAMEGPPFSVNTAEISAHYATCYKVKCLQKVEVAGGLKGVCAAEEQAWYLAPVITTPTA